MTNWNGSIRNRWRDAVVLTPALTGTVKVTLLVLHDYMKDTGYVSVPAKKMAERLNRHPRKILQHYADAIAAGFLVRVEAGHVGRTATYRAQIPSLERVPISSTLSDGQRVPKADTLSVSESGTLSDGERVLRIGTPVVKGLSPTSPTTDTSDNDEKRQLEEGVKAA